MTEPVYAVGIDLGTTNSVVAYIQLNPPKEEYPRVQIFAIPQLTEPGTVESRKTLPSFILVPASHEVPEESLALPWQESRKLAVGEFARNRGEEIPHRLISSAKSWLCNTLVDRNRPILPWEGAASGDSALKKFSPVEASAEILHHIREAWNHKMAGNDPDMRLENQDILLTVPASFDAVARELTVKAAEDAGLARVTLLEEPQAAFYAWIDSEKEMWREQIQEGDLALVCDVGGGTSDFSLIRVSQSEGDLALERVAVGSHLLVGGDNMDLALAYAVAGEMAKEGKKLSSKQIRGLLHTLRRHKENVLKNPEIDEVSVTVLGGGSGLIGGSKKKIIPRKTFESIVLDGFFPDCSLSDKPVTQTGMGIQEVGLSYEADPAVTRHLADFITRGNQEEKTFPNKVLFNGGVMKAPAIRQKVVSVLSAWNPESRNIEEIPTRDLDLSVAKGAAYYGYVRKGEGIRIRAGLNRSYYIGVAAAMPAVPGLPTPVRALCVAPFGMEEGESRKLENREFILRVGDTVKFDFLGSATRTEDTTGTVVDDWEGEIEEVAVLETTLEGEPGASVPVHLEVQVTEIGTITLWCVSREEPDKRWKLEFNIRELPERATQ